MTSICAGLGASVGYSSYWYGKGHTGYLSTNHLPVAHNFSDHYGYLGGLLRCCTWPALPCCSSFRCTGAARWHNEMPAVNSSQYSSDAYGSAALRVVESHPTTEPFFLYLPFQAVHTPYDLPSSSSLGRCPPTNSTIKSLMCDADAWVGKIVAALKSRGTWCVSHLV